MRKRNSRAGKSLKVDSRSLSAPCLAAHCFRASALSRNACADRSRAQGRQVVWYTSVDLAGGRENRKGLRVLYPGLPRASTGRAPSACSSASARNTAAASTRSTWSILPTPRISSSGSATAGSHPMFPKTWPSTFRPSTRTRMECSPLGARGSASSATTPVW